MKYVFLFLAFIATHVFGERELDGVTFKEGSGIQMGIKTKESIGLKTVEVEDRATRRDIRFTAQVYREAHEVSQNQGEPSGFAYASAWVDGSTAAQLTNGTTLLINGANKATGVVMRTDRTMVESGGPMEVLIQIHDNEQVWKIGTFAYAESVSDESSTATMIPISAVLETAYGPFAFVANGAYFTRTEISLGARIGDHIEITDGLYSGDVVVAQPVETLYLIELRATKGGGHSH